LTRLTRIVVRIVVFWAVLLPVTAAGAHDQKFIEGLWLGTESGDVVELIAWAEAQRFRPWKMANGSLEDAPVLPRTYRILNSMPAWQMVGVVAATTDIFKVDPDRFETLELPFSAVKLTITTVEIGIPELENFDNVLRIRRTLKARDDKPLYFFLALYNGVVTRFYPFRIDRPEP
jgi:hypothetical protein